MTRQVRTLASLLVAGSLPCGVAACDDEPSSYTPEEARIYLVATIDPDLTVPSDPAPGRIVWFSTRAGRARFLSGAREVADQAQVSGGELATTTLDPLELEPGVNTIEIRLVLSRSAGEIFTQSQVYVAAECTWHEHCAGSCVQFSCQ
jgi:hypothetical protein